MTTNFNAIIFNTLGVEYEEMISALPARRKPVSYAELCILLVIHEIRLSSTQSAMVSSIVPIANVAHTQSKVNNTNRFHRGCACSRGFSDRHDPCPVYGMHDHSPYHCRFHHDGSAGPQTNSPQF